MTANERVTDAGDGQKVRQDRVPERGVEGGTRAQGPEREEPEDGALVQLTQPLSWCAAWSRGLSHSPRASEGLR
jgi:hypothetical protein